MKIAVCMKQVPALSEGNMDDKTGVIIRSNKDAVVNKYDLQALETALKIKEKIGTDVSITAFTMGPLQAESVLKEAYAMGADEGFLICDKAFAGADVLATSYTLMQAIHSVGEFDLILCGKQTTDGDTAQVSGALAKWFEIPHINWVYELVDVSEEKICVKNYMGTYTLTSEIPYPCLLSVEPTIFTARMPSLKLKLKSKSKKVTILTLNDFSDQKKERYGLLGSATRVKKIYPPKRTEKKELVQRSSQEAAEYIYSIFE